MLTFICQNPKCSKEFKAYRETAQFCSIKCRDSGKIIAEKEGELFIRYCPTCKTKISYKSKYNCSKANKNEIRCSVCAQDTEKNKLFQQSRKGKPVDKAPYQTKEFLDKMSKVSSGKNNPMYGKKVYDIWLEKYGKEEADKRKQAAKEKHLKNIKRGKDCWMYNRPPPQGTGNGWKGWYKEKYFRSLRELMFMIKLDSENRSWINGETISIKYKFMDKETHYRPDFLVGNVLYEIKPTKLHNSPKIKAKELAAIEYCKIHNLEYKIIDIEINSWLILDAYEQKLIKFDRDYDFRFKKYIVDKIKKEMEFFQLW